MHGLASKMKELQSMWADIGNSDFLTEGKYVRMFEERVSEWSGMHAIAMNSAGTGLYAIMRCLMIPREDGIKPNVMVPNNTFFATGAMVKEAGFKPILVDCSKSDFSMSLASLTKLSAANVSAVVLTHVGGSIAIDYQGIAMWCRSRGIPLIEDAAHVLGVGRGSMRTCAGSLGNAAVFSMYPTKAIPAGEGGIVVTQDADLAERLRQFRNYGKYRDEEGVLRHSMGFNFRMDEWTAAVAYLQMRDYKAILAEREALAEKMSKIVAPFRKGVLLTNWYKYIVDASFPAKKEAGKVYAFTDQLQQAMHQTPNPFLPNSEWVAKNHKCLPFLPNKFKKWSAPQIEKFIMEP